MNKVIIKLAFASVLITGAISINSCGSQSNTSETMNEKITTESFKVFGNCEMCKKTIESSNADEEGISSIDWNKETKMVRVSFNEAKISLDQIKKNIVNSGYDTEEIKANDDTYNDLPMCCQYSREK